MKFESTMRTMAGKLRKPPTRKMQKFFLENFMRTGCSGIHTQHGHTLAPILNHCNDKGIPFTLHYLNGHYYLMKGSVFEKDRAPKVDKYVVHDATAGGKNGTLHGPSTANEALSTYDSMRTQGGSCTVYALKPMEVDATLRFKGDGQ